MHGQFAIGIAITLINIAIHTAVMTSVSRTVHRTSLVTQAARAHLRLMLVMMATTCVLTLAHLISAAVMTAGIVLLLRNHLQRRRVNRLRLVL